VHWSSCYSCQIKHMPWNQHIPAGARLSPAEPNPAKRGATPLYYNTQYRGAPDGCRESLRTVGLQVGAAVSGYSTCHRSFRDARMVLSTPAAS